MKKKKLDFLRNFKELPKKMGIDAIINPAGKFYNCYFNRLKKDCETLGNVSAGAVRLEDMYVLLKLREFDQESHFAVEKERAIEPAAVVNHYQLLVILGGAGVGKTTLLKYLTWTYCKKNIEKPEQREGEHNPIPIPIILREFLESGKGLRDYINTIFEKYGFPKARKVVEKDLRGGRCILLLDGFDELITRKNQEEVSHEIFAFIEKYHECKIVVTARTPGYHGELLGFTRFEMMGFDNNQVKEFINKRFAGSPGKAEAMFQLLKDNEDIQNLVKNPLILSIIACRCEENNEVLHKRADIYKRIIEVLLGEWDAHKNIASQFPPDQKGYILRKLAVLNHRRDRRTITEKEILEEIDKYSLLLGLKKEECRLFFEEIWQRSSILRQLFIDTYEFLQLSFQAYFTALEFNERGDGIATIIHHLSDSWWEAPILFYSGMSASTSSLVKQIQKQPEDIFYTNLMLSGKCTADGTSIDPLLKEEIVQKLWLLYNTSEFILLKEKAMAVLSRIKPRRIVDLLVNQLTDKEPYLQRRAAETLGSIGSVEILPVLIMILVKEKETKIRSHAAISLGKIGSWEAMRPLIGVLHTDKDSEVRKSAAEALGLIGSTEALPDLIKVLTTDKDNQVRIGAAEALGKIKGDMTVSQLIRTLATEKDSSVRWRIAMSLGKLGGTNARDMLIKTLSKDEAREVRESAAEALGLIGSEECIGPLIQALTLDKDADVRGSAAYALGLMRSTAALSELIKSLITDTNGEVRGRAAYALGQLRNTEAIPYLTIVLNTHKASFIRGNATFALGQIGGVEAIPFLTHALTLDQDSYVRFRAAEVLGGIGDTMTIPPLKASLADDGNYYGWKVKDKAFEALEKISQRLQVRIFNDNV
ncbi:MAG: HEAT repeat domain-containing protein [Candidatus Aminicenantes bacterium]|jgi:HEAT repeat protein